MSEHMRAGYGTCDECAASGVVYVVRNAQGFYSVGSTEEMPTTNRAKAFRYKTRTWGCLPVIRADAHSHAEAMQARFRGKWRVVRLVARRSRS